MTTRTLPFAAAVAAAIFAAGTARPQALPGEEGVQITFLANEGVMLSSGSRKVLIDALFLKYKQGFAIPADSTQAALHAARAPFDSVDLILVTHRHGDHFHPVPVAEHLRANPRATLLASQQVLDSLRGHAPARALPGTQLMAGAVLRGARRREVVNGVTVELLGLPHANLEHLGFIVELGGRRVLHLGDIDGGQSAFSALATLRLDTARIDVALIPEWIVTSEEGRRAIERWIRPRHVAVFHVMEGAESRARRAVQQAIPGAVTFVRPLDARRW